MEICCPFTSELNDVPCFQEHKWRILWGIGANRRKDAQESFRGHTDKITCIKIISRETKANDWNYLAFLSAVCRILVL